MLWFIILFVVNVIYVCGFRKQIQDRPSKLMLDAYVGYWTIAIILSIIRIGGLYEVGDYTYFIIIISLFSFIVGFCFVSIPVSLSNDVVLWNQTTFNIERIIKNKMFLIILGCVCIYVYKTLIVFFNAVLFSQSLGEVRTEFYSGELYGSVFNQVNAFVLTPFSIISTPIFAYLIFFKRNWVCCLLGFFLFGYESLGGGRIGYIRIFIAIIFVLCILLNTQQIYKKKFHRFISVTGISLFALLALLTTLRTVGYKDSADSGIKESINGLIEHICSYTAGPIVAFDYSLNHDYEGQIGGLKYGQLTFSAPIGAINLFTSRLGFTFPMALHDLVEIKQNKQIQVSEKITYFNALYTSNLFFYYDLGVLGVILFPFLLGFTIRKLIKRMYIKKAALNMIIIVSWCFYVMLFSVMDYKLVNPYVILTLFILYYFNSFRVRY